MSTAQVDSIYTLEKLTMYAVKDMEDYGCRVDVPYLKEQQIALTKELKGLEEDTQLIAPGINAESPSQIVKFFLDNNVAIPEKDGTTSDDDEDDEDDPYEEAQPSRINRMYPDRLGLFKGTPKSTAKKSQETEEKKSYSVDKKVLSEIDHPLAVCVLRHRKLTKFKSSYVDTILDFQDNEVIRPNFRTLKARTGRLSCVDPALQTIPKDKDVAGEAMTYEQGLSIRRTFIPRPNCWLVPIDYSQQEFRLFVHYAKNKQLTDRYKAGDFDFHDVVAEMTGLSRTDAKTCIAEGELVLTDHGEVPIECVTTDMLVWDGCEWVQHDGVIYKGVKEVVYYDGLWATPDHEVFLEDGSTCSFECAKQMGAELARKLPAREVIRYNRDNWKKCAKRLYSGGLRLCKLSSNRREMYRLWSAERLSCGQSDNWKNSFLRLSEKYKIRKSGAGQHNRGAVRCNLSKMHQPKISRLRAIWRSGHQEFVRFKRVLHKMGAGESSSQHISRRTIRQDRQQRSLHAGEYTFSHCTRKYYEQANKQMGGLQGAKSNSSTCLAFNENRSSRTRVWKNAHETTNCLGMCPGTDIRKKESKRMSRVYDIGNAGPRHRFVVSNKLVANCTFGILYGMGDKKLANRLKCTLKEAERIKAKYFRNVAGAEDLIKLTMNTAKARGYVRTLYGRPRFLYYRNRLGVQVDECHKALNTIIQGGCADIMKIMLVKINKFLKYRDGVPYTYPYGVRIILTIHDEIILEVPYGQEGIIPAIKTTLEYIPQVNVPMVAEVSLCEHDWSDKKKVTPEMLDEWRKKPVKVLPPYTVDPYIIHPFMEYEDYPKIGLFANL